MSRHDQSGWCKLTFWKAWFRDYFKGDSTIQQRSKTSMKELFGKGALKKDGTEGKVGQASQAPWISCLNLPGAVLFSSDQVA